MRLAAVDIGSNTSLLLIMEKTSQRGFEVLMDQIYFTRLAENISQSGELSESALSRLDSAFAHISSQLKLYRVNRVSLVATSAARQAKNKDRLFALGKSYNLPPIEIISSKREAELAFIGAFFGLGSELSKALVVDIGGGSTELVDSRKTYSLNMGSVSLTERFFRHGGPFSSEELKPLSQAISSQLQTLKNFLNGEADDPYEGFIFTAGTPITLAFMEKQTTDPNLIHGLVCRTQRVEDWLQRLSKMSLEERKKIPYLPEHRADVIIAGLSLLLEILKLGRREDFIVSHGGVRYGLILEQAHSSTSF